MFGPVAVTFRAGGGCFEGSFQMSVKVEVDFGYTAPIICS